MAVFDAATEKIMWRGSLEANISLPVPAEQRHERVREMSKRLLEKLPRQRPSVV